jgi:hypothetical protein
MSIKPRNDFDFDRAPRMGAAVRQIDGIVADGEWHSWYKIVHSVAPDADLMFKTVSNLLHEMVRNGVLERRGKWVENHPDCRQVRLPERNNDTPDNGADL